MTSSANNDLKVPYEIGRFIASQVPNLDSSMSADGPWAEHQGHFKSGPHPLRHQMKQGLLLEVVNHSHRPRAIHTRYGEWVVLASASGSFDKVFEVVQKKLNLKKIEEISDKNISYWAIQSWNDITLEEPVPADKEAGEFISSKAADAAYEEFEKSLLK
jgi:hypothetical protein